MGTMPEPVNAASFETTTPIKHVVYIIKENRTFDHMFGRFPGVNGVTTGMDGDVERPLTPATRGAIVQDIEHCYECAIEAWNEGRMDGFNRDEASDRDAYTQFLPEDLPNYWHWAERFVLLDNFFTSAHGPSFQNHLYAIAAHSGWARGNPVQDKDLLRGATSLDGPVQGVGVRLGRRRLRRGGSRGRRDRPHVPVLRLRDRGWSARREGHPVGVLLRDAVPERVPLVRLLGDRPLPQRSRSVEAPHLPRRQPRTRHRGGSAPPGHVGDASLRGVRAPRVQLLLG